MGLNAYLEGLVTKGSTTVATATAATRTIDGKPGKRIVVLRYSFISSVSSPTAYVQSAIEATTGTAATGASTLTISTIVGAIASGDTICYVSDNGKYNYAVASAGCTSSLLALDASAAVATAITSGAVYWLGPYNGSAAAAVACTAGFTATTGNSDVACFAANIKGSPMRFHIPTGVTSQPVDIQYVTAGYTNV